MQVVSPSSRKADISSSQIRKLAGDSRLPATLRSIGCSTYIRWYLDPLLAFGDGNIRYSYFPYQLDFISFRSRPMGDYNLPNRLKVKIGSASVLRMKRGHFVSFSRHRTTLRMNAKQLARLRSHTSAATTKKEWHATSNYVKAGIN